MGTKSNIEIIDGYIKEISEDASKAFFECNDIPYDEISNVKGCVVLKETGKDLGYIVQKAKTLLQRDLAHIINKTHEFE